MGSSENRANQFAIFATWVPMVLFFGAGLAFAGQDGRIVVKEAVLHERPDPASPILGRVKQGELLRISNQSRQGWYRAVLPKPVGRYEFAWIRESDLRIDFARRELRASGIELKDPPSSESGRLNAVIQLDFGMGINSARGLAELASVSPGIGMYVRYGGALLFRLHPVWLAGPFGEGWSFSHTVTGATLSASGVAAGIQVQRELPAKATDSVRFSVSGGVGAAGILSALATDASATQFVPARAWVPLVQAGLAMVWKIESSWGLAAAIHGRFAESASASLSGGLVSFGLRIDL